MKTVAIVLLLGGLGALTDLPVRASVSPSNSVYVLPHKYVTVLADSAGDAMAKAQDRNPGWVAAGVKKMGEGRSYRVKLQRS